MISLEPIAVTALSIDERAARGAGYRQGTVERAQLEEADASQDTQSHPLFRSFAFAAVGSSVGLSLGLLAANQCIGTRAPSHDRIIFTCDALPTIGSAAAALILPSLGSALGSGIGGRTDMSHGKPLHAIVGGAMSVIPAYAVVLSGRRMDSDVLSGIGYAVLVVGVPVVTTFADHQFRKLRRRDPPAH